jgi:hypothetical protein
MSEKRYTEGEVNAMVAEIEQGLSDEQVAERKAEIEKKYGLSPGALNKLNLSTEGVKTGNKVGTFEAIDHWPYYRPVARPKEEIPDVFVVSEALIPKKQDSSSDATSEKKKPTEEKSAREIYADSFRSEKDSKK